MDSTTDASSSSQPTTNPIYTDRGSRISKENLFMVLALWMEQFPVRDDDNQDADSFRKVGAVLVLGYQMACSMLLTAVVMASTA